MFFVCVCDFSVLGIISTSLDTSYPACANLYLLTCYELGSAVCKRSGIFTWTQTQRHYPQRPQATKVRIVIHIYILLMKCSKNWTGGMVDQL